MWRPRTTNVSFGQNARVAAPPVRCVAMQTFIFKHGYRGGSCMARQLSGMKGVPRGALVIGIDDDE